MNFIRTCFLSMISVFAVSCGDHETQSSHDSVTDSVMITARVGGPCDGCEIMYVGMPEDIPSEDKSPVWKQYETDGNGSGTQICVEGSVYQLDGKTPAKNVILYYHHTNDTGYYAKRDYQDPKAKRHGYIRGWVKTDSAGKYALYTIRPAPYPGEKIPAHIHWYILEPDVPNEYYIADTEFDDDTLLTPELRSKRENRGGTQGITGRAVRMEEIVYYNRDIILGMNIPDYQKK